MRFFENLATIMTDGIRVAIYYWVSWDVIQWNGPVISAILKLLLIKIIIQSFISYNFIRG